MPAASSALRLFAFAAAAVLVGCGGSGDDGGSGAAATVVLVDQTTTASATSATPRANWTLLHDGPTFMPTGPASVEVCAQGEWMQTVTGTANLNFTASLAEPVDVASPAAGVAATAGQRALGFTRCHTYSSTGTALRSTRMAFEVKQTSGANALTDYSVSVRWIVRATYQ